MFGGVCADNPYEDTRLIPVVFATVPLANNLIIADIRNTVSAVCIGTIRPQGVGFLHTNGLAVRLFSWGRSVKGADALTSGGRAAFLLNNLLATMLIWLGGTV